MSQYLIRWAGQVKTLFFDSRGRSNVVTFEPADGRPISIEDTFSVICPDGTEVPGTLILSGRHGAILGLNDTFQIHKDCVRRKKIEDHLLAQFKEKLRGWREPLQAE